MLRVKSGEFIWLVEKSHLADYLQAILSGSPVALTDYAAVPHRRATLGWQSEKGEQATVDLDVMMGKSNAEERARKFCGTAWPRGR